MGRFDALRELDEQQPLNQAETPVAQPPPPPRRDTVPVAPAPQAGKSQGADGKKPANPQARKTANLPLADVEKPEKYTTRLEPSLVKKIRLEAIEKDVKDYEVVRTALNQYFENNK
jgi:hypothetical protein